MTVGKDECARDFTPGACIGAPANLRLLSIPRPTHKGVVWWCESDDVRARQGRPMTGLTRENLGKSPRQGTPRVLQVHVHSTRDPEKRNMPH